MVQNNGKSRMKGQATSCIWDKWPEKRDEGRREVRMSGSGQGMEKQGGKCLLQTRPSGTDRRAVYDE
ncbi:hypothetical protein EG028_02655 [Chitinophaga barathri]|uniref:Uncharacterized protein n=1 Tax=Chitinophaga barathri TaxID=1647451 RepID=A0A3N4MIE1_9BACT|nr:hypothetical protein EG028_02655 [Chitinophaga barathri]